MVKTKIICTLGPASSEPSVLRKMMLGGMDVARLNFSHGNIKTKLRLIALVRQLNRKYRRRIRILGDLQGQRIRIGRLKSPIELKKRQTLELARRDISGYSDTVPFDYPGDLEDIGKGQPVFIDDGNIELEVTGHKKGLLITRVITPGILYAYKGVNIPRAKLKFSGLSPSDKNCINFCIQEKFDFIAQSFVRMPQDMLQIRRILAAHRSSCRIIAKIENMEGIKNIDGIISVSDGIMIARGDLGVSLPIYEVPVLQKEIIKKCGQFRKFVITATQMLESMTGNLRPTRAEVSDVANAIIDGSDYLMLSGETAVGRYPVETVRMMNEVIKFTEHYLQLLKQNRRRGG